MNQQNNFLIKPLLGVRLNNVKSDKADQTGVFELHTVPQPSNIFKQPSRRFNLAVHVGRRYASPSRPQPVVMVDNNSDSTNNFYSHTEINIPNQQPIVRRRPCFLYLLYLLVVMFATFFLYAVVCTILSILRVR
jgi:hypothetical protein